MKTVTPRSRKQPSKAAIRRAVASSTAIETGKSVRSIEGQLRIAMQGKFRTLKLAG
jgi:hypothetical protein